MPGMTQPHVDPPTITLIKENNYGKSDKYVVKIKLRGYPTSPTLDLYEFKFSLLDKGKLEELVLLVCNFKMTLAESGSWRQARSINTFVLFSAENRCVSLTHCLLT